MSFNETNDIQITLLDVSPYIEAAIPHRLEPLEDMRVNIKIPNPSPSPPVAGSRSYRGGTTLLAGACSCLVIMDEAVPIGLPEGSNMFVWRHALDFERKGRAKRLT